MKKSKRGICMADGGITQETPDQLMARMTAKYGVPTGATQQPQPQSTQQAPQQPPPKSNPLGIMSMLKGRSAQIDKAVNGYADGGILENAADYWANSNAEFEKTNPNFGQRVLRGVNPITGFGSAVGAMKRPLATVMFPAWRWLALAPFRHLGCFAPSLLPVQ